MESNITHLKDKGHLLVLASILGLPSSMFLWPLLMAGVTSRSLEVSAYILPISVVFIYFIYRVYASSKKKILISDAGLLVEELSPHSIPWNDILSVKIVEQPILRGPTAQWLMLKTKYDDKFSSKLTKNINNVVLGNGVVACNLTTYIDNAEIVKSNINERIRP